MAEEELALAMEEERIETMEDDAGREEEVVATDDEDEDEDETDLHRPYPA